MIQIATLDTPAGRILAALGGGRRLNRVAGVGRICEVQGGVTFGLHQAGRIAKIVADAFGTYTVQLIAQNSMTVFVETGRASRIVRERRVVPEADLREAFIAVTRVELPR